MKVRMYFLVTVIGALFYTSQVYADYASDQVDKIVPVSPNAAALGMYGQIPVGYYTGVPNISVPIYEINVGGFRIPIELKYHASGIKVAQEASTVGLGWVLNAGGCITREIRHLDDFDSNLTPRGYYYDNSSVPVANQNNDMDLAFVKTNNSDTNLYQYLINNKDSEPDMFYFNFGGHSGSFFFNKMGTGNNTSTSAEAIVQNKTEYLKIKYINIDINSNSIDHNTFEIYDAYGNKYLFNSSDDVNIYTASIDFNYENKEYYDYYFLWEEYAKSKYIEFDMNPYHYQERYPEPKVKTTWYLDKIITANNDIITFDYTEEEIYTTVRMSEDISYLLTQDIMQGSGGGSLSSDLLPKYQYYNASYTRSTDKLLNHIEFNGGEVCIEYSDRKDIESTTSKKAQKIEYIIIKNNYGEIIKKLHFNYSYLGDDSKPSTCRLMLDKIDLLDNATSEVSQSYSFDYNRNPLPEKYSRNTDHWGYYTSRPYYIGAMGFTAAPIFVMNIPWLIWPYGLYGVDKRSDNSSIRNGILTSIQYPTGGKTLFEYELHNFSNDMTDYAVGKLASTTSSKGVEGLSPVFEVGAYGAYFDLNYRHEKATTTNTTIEILSKNSYGNFVTYNTAPLSKSNLGGSKKVYLPPGTYRLRIINTNISVSTYVELVYYYETSATTGGGLRIRKITDISDINKISSERIFSYDDGILMVTPEYHGYFSLVNTRYLVLPGNVLNYIYAGSYVFGSSIPLTPLTGIPVGYSYVTEINTTNGINSGYTIYSFENRENRTIFTGDRIVRYYPSIPYMNNGLPKNIQYYNANDELIKEHIYEYKRVEKDSIKAMMCYKPPMVYGYTTYSSPYDVKFYDVFSERWVLTKEDETYYYPGNKSVTTTTEYGYNSTNWKKNYEKTTVSGDQMVTRITYPVDYSDAISQKMTSKYMVGVPIEQIKIRNDKVVAAQKTEFSLASNVGTYLPLYTYSLDATLPVPQDTYSQYYSKDLTFKQYDSHGNVVQYMGRADLPVTYLWSYNGKYPVAEIRGVTYDDVATHIAGGANYIAQLSDKVVMSESDTATLNALRASLPNALVTTYTYEPLVGVASITDPSGRITRYSYDGLGRLIQIRDNQDKLVESYIYNIKNQ